MITVPGLAHDILRIRGKDLNTCTSEDLKSAYARAEWMAESLLRILKKPRRRAEREAA